MLTMTISLLGLLELELGVLGLYLRLLQLSCLGPSLGED